MDPEIKLSLSTVELDFILDYQLANKPQFKKLMALKEELLEKRPDFKRANITLNISDLDALLTNVTREANKKNNTDENQYLLGGLFGKLAEKYQKLKHS
jgi:hypothetical protein